MTRAERRRQARALGQHRGTGKKGSRARIRSAPEPQRFDALEASGFVVPDYDPRKLRG